MAVVWGMIAPVCVFNDQCGTTGTYCGRTKVYIACGWDSGMPLQVDSATGLASNVGFDPGNDMGGLSPGASLRVFLHPALRFAAVGCTLDPYRWRYYIVCIPIGRDVTLCTLTAYIALRVYTESL
jgi:hypothetical protein